MTTATAHAQRMTNLRTANRVRTFRAELKRNLRAGAPVAAVILHPAPELLTMRVAALLLAVPGWGQFRVERFMRAYRLSAAKTVGSLSERQRAEIAEALS